MRFGYEATIVPTACAITAACPAGRRRASATFATVTAAAATVTALQMRRMRSRGWEARLEPPLTAEERAHLPDPGPWWYVINTVASSLATGVACQPVIAVSRRLPTALAPAAAGLTVLVGQTATAAVAEFLTVSMLRGRRLVLQAVPDRPE